MPAGPRELLIDEAHAGERLDKLLAAQFPDLSRARIQALIESGAVLCDGVVVDVRGRKARPGERYVVRVPEPEAAAPAPQAIPLAVVYEDDEVIVIDKPAGLTVHPAPGHASGTLVNALLAHCDASLSGIGGVKRPGIVHRLDKDTTGLLVVAKTDRAHQSLAAQFAAHGADGRLERGYRAIVWGVPERSRGTVEAPIGRSRHNRTRMAVVPEAAGRWAATRFEVLETFAADDTTPGAKPIASELALTLETGRTHQVRVHMAHIGHPLLGDAAYGAGFKASARHLGAEAQAALAALGRQALHAALLGFEHPVTGKPMRFESPLPADMRALQEALRGRAPAMARRDKRR
ncbi:MAG: RluA family pseudouridine synthase [Hyphomicrobiales bacterium]|nr:MAG: RluA family pseudouridine synthase [Hyphomicrobiales bacterium]